MTKTINIEGMMCGHCEMSVKKALEALDGVTGAEVSHEKGTAVVSFDTEVADDVLKKAVEDKDYKVTAVQPVDMFPHTHHVENVVRLERRE